MALIVSLVLLISMTLLALAAMQNTSLEERMAGNVRAENIALQAAEAALREGEAWLDSLAVLPRAENTGSGSDDLVSLWFRADSASEGPNSKAPDKSPWWQFWTDDDWESFADRVTTSLVFVAEEGRTVGISAPGRLPRFVIEEDGFQRSSLVVGQQQDSANQGNRFRITARGRDAGGRGQVLVQSRFVRRF
jgi:type IV pilus assembly protein PilX